MSEQLRHALPQSMRMRFRNIYVYHISSPLKCIKIISRFSSSDFLSNGWRLSFGMFISSKISVNLWSISSIVNFMISLCKSCRSPMVSDSDDIGRPPFVVPPLPLVFGRPNHMSNMPPPDFDLSCFDIIASFSISFFVVAVVLQSNANSLLLIYTKRKPIKMN